MSEPKIFPTVAHLLGLICLRRDHELVTFGNHDQGGLLGIKDKTDGDKIFAVTVDSLNQWYGVGPLGPVLFVADLGAAKDGKLSQRVKDALGLEKPS